MKLRSPIPKKYHNQREVCILTQLFGANKNKLFYGKDGHQGLDMRTVGVFKYNFNKFFGWAKLKREEKESTGGIEIVASHDGYLSMGYNDNYKDGIYVKIRSEDDKYETLYFHLSKIRRWKGDDNTAWDKRKGREDFVKAGTVIGWGGNSGKYTTGAHLHFELRKFIGGSFIRLDPIKYLTDGTIYQLYRGLAPSRFFYKGAEIDATQVKAIRALLKYKV